MKKKTKLYKIPVGWEMYGWMTVEAVSLKHAIQIAENVETPLPDGHYVDASFNLDEQIIEALYPKEAQR